MFSELSDTEKALAVDLNTVL